MIVGTFVEFSKFTGIILKQAPNVSKVLYVVGNDDKFVYLGDATNPSHPAATAVLVSDGRDDHLSVVTEESGSLYNLNLIDIDTEKLILYLSVGSKVTD